MPGEPPFRGTAHRCCNRNRKICDVTAGDVDRARDTAWVIKGSTRRARAWLRAGVAVATTLLPGSAFAQQEQTVLSGFLPESLSASIGSMEILMLASFGGAMSFAILAASWMIRERSRMETENASLNKRLFDLKAQNERINALVSTTDQRIVVWDGDSEKPALQGTLKSDTGAPDNRSKFLAFGTWLSPTSSKDFETALADLRLNATPFDLAVETRGGGVLQTQGRTSGRYAFVRFIELSGEREELARLTARHQRLHASFDNIQALFDAMETPVWLRDRIGKLYWANDAYARAVEAENPRAVIDQNLDLFDRNEREQIEARLANDTHFSGQLPAVFCGDRKMLDVVSVATENGRAGIAIDQSEADRLRSLLKGVEESHARMLDQLATAVAIFDNTRHLEFYNSSFQKLWELETGFLDQKPSHDEVMEAIRSNQRLPEQQDWAKWREQQKKVYTSIEPIEDWWHLPDGTALRVIASPHAPGGASWTFENVTEQLALESNYNALMRTQGETLDHLSEAVAVFGTDGKLRLCNPALRTLWGLEDTDLPDAESKRKGAHVTALMKRFEPQVVDAGRLSEIRLKITGLDEERASETGRMELADSRMLDYTLVPLPDGQTMLTLVDVTARVNIERALKERAEALQESDALKSRFLQHVSYELRAPLTTISGFGEMLATPDFGSLNPRQREYLDHINSASDSLRMIIDDILDLATIDAGAMELDLQPVALSQIIDASLVRLQDVLEERSLRIEKIIGKRAENLVVDDERVQQILENLLSNAARHSPDGGKITIQGEHEQDWIAISVSDQGEGIPEDAREGVFNRFESGTNQNRGEGTGLGLAIVKSFVELHGGTVEITDGEKRGTRIICRFPTNPLADRQAAE